ncbi:fimbria/pilus periplasmic chaperone [Klebsiella quasipneumoniae]|uniref:fimbria/pilus periplasmic chaperone n=1 Tax=Klebsiella quasipneumoniae TaxID=1463165 RepID=UPI00352BC4B0
MNSYNKYKVLSCFLFFFLVSFNSYASVVMTGTRIIYNSESRSVDVNLKNTSNFPYVVQTWFDNGKITDGPDTSVRVPFIATPPVFRIQPSAGQVVKVVYTDALKLPQDRESVFYFNFLQVPPSNIDNSSSKNKMLIMLRNRVKIFYRPSSLSLGPSKKFPDIIVSKTPGNISAVTINNNSPFYVTIGSVMVREGKRSVTTPSGMIDPFGKSTFIFPGAISINGKKVIVTIVNDQGARLNAEYNL